MQRWSVKKCNTRESNDHISIITLTVDVHGLKIGIFTFHFVSGFPAASQLAGRCSRNRMRISIRETRMEIPIV
jgi:hypothetical protein